MTDKAKNFIYLLEREKAPIQDGYYYFDSSIFSNPSWYRLNNRLSQWQITFDLVKWYNVSDISIELNIENLYIVNYLKIKEIKNNIVIMTKNNEDFLNTMCNNIYIDVSKYKNEYNDNTVSEIIQHINEANNNIINIKSQINQLELDYQLRANKKNIEFLKRDLIYWNTQYHYLIEDYYVRQIELKNNCIKNTEMCIGIYEDTKNELELTRNALSIMESKYNDKCYDYANLLKSNKKLNEDIKSCENHSIEQSMKISALEIELKDKNDSIKNLKNDINITLNNHTLNLDNRINCLYNENKMYQNKISNLESKIDSNVNDNLNYKNLINNLQNKIKFYEDEEKHFLSSNEISRVKINQLELSKFNLERANEKLKAHTQNCITNDDNFQKEMSELREKLCLETVNKIKIINDAQLLLNSTYTWNDEKQIFEENDFEILE